MEENKKTSKEILPESERKTIMEYFKSRISVPSSIALSSVIALEAAEREVDEKERRLSTAEFAYSWQNKCLEEEKNTNQKLKREIEELKSKLDISGYKGNINENLC